MAARIASPAPTTYSRHSHYIPSSMSRTRRPSGSLYGGNASSILTSPTRDYTSTTRDYTSTTRDYTSTTRPPVGGYSTSTYGNAYRSGTSSYGGTSATRRGTTGGTTDRLRSPSVTTGTTDRLRSQFESSNNRYSGASQSTTPRASDIGSYTSTRKGSAGLARERPLPPGPGPLDEYGRRMTISESLKRTSRASEPPPTRTGPLRATHNTTSTYQASNSVTSSSPLRSYRRTNSVSDLTKAVDNLDMNSSGSLSRSRNYGSQADVNRLSSKTPDRSLFDSSSDAKDISQCAADRRTERASPTSRKHVSGQSSTDSDYSPPSTLPSLRRRSQSQDPSIARDSRQSPVSPSSPTTRAPCSPDSPATHRSSFQSNKQYSTSQSPSDVSSSRGLVGLKNLGNTCFMNSILQCLSNTRPLLEFCLQDEYKEDINRSTSNMKGALVTAYAKLQQQLWKSAGSDPSCSPTDLKSQIQKHASRFMGYNQQDAQEFLIYLLEGLHEDLNRVTVKKKNIISNDDGEEKISASEKARQTWKKYLERDNSKIVDMFVGQLRSALSCQTCGYTSNTLDPFWDISLPIKKSRSYGGSECSLTDCFDLFTTEEVLDGDEKPTCARCKERRRCVKSFSIQKFPKLLVIHLKRFDQGSYMRSKLSTLVDYPLRDLDLSQYAAETGGSPVCYSLYAVANHSGTPFSGHYTAYAKHPYSGEWHYYNDARVSKASSSSVKSSEGYVLFYELSNQHSRL